MVAQKEKSGKSCRTPSSTRMAELERWPALKLTVRSSSLKGFKIPKIPRRANNQSAFIAAKNVPTMPSRVEKAINRNHVAVNRVEIVKKVLKEVTSRHVLTNSVDAYCQSTPRKMTPWKRSTLKEKLGFEAHQKVMAGKPFINNMGTSRSRGWSSRKINPKRDPCRFYHGKERQVVPKKSEFRATYTVRPVQ